MVVTMPMGLLDKARSLAAWSVCVGLFATVGWTTLRPEDPLGAVSLASTPQGVIAWLQVAALGAAVAAIATVLIGHRLPDAGLFAVALGLAAVNLRGADAASLLITLQPEEGAARAGFGGVFILETLGWFAIVAAVAVVNGLLAHWFYPFRDAESGEAPPPAEAALVVTELRAVIGAGGPSTAPRRAGWTQGVKQLAVTLAVSLIVLRLLSVGAAPRAVNHGQVYFAVATALYLGVIAGSYPFPTPSALWGCLAVPLLACMGYTVVWLDSDTVTAAGGVTASHIPSSMFLRALPLTYVSVGTAAVMAAYWFTLRWPRPVPTASPARPVR